MMRLRLFMFFAVALLLLAAGCSKDSPTQTSPGIDYSQHELVARPEFIDTRPRP